jgi:multidrug efflux pump
MIGVTGFGLLLTPVFYVVLRKMRGGKLKDHRHDDDAEPGKGSTEQHSGEAEERTDDPVAVP